MDSFQTPLRYPRGLRPARVFFVFGGRNAASFFVPGNAPKLRRNIPAAALSIMSEKWDNSGMEQIIQTLSCIGMPVTEIERVLAYYGEDMDGLQHYVLYMRAMLDDRHEYVD